MGALYSRLVCRTGRMRHAETIKVKITKRQLRRVLKEEVAYHSTDPANVPRIQHAGLLTGQESAHTTGGAWADEHYGTRPIYISMQKGKYEGQPLAIDIAGLALVADLPGLIDTGAMIEEEGIYWDFGEEPQAFMNLVDEDGMIYFEDLVDPSHPASQVAIELTGTAAVLENIPPDRIQLIESKKMKITKRRLRRIIREEVTRLSRQVDAPKPKDIGIKDVMDGMPQKTEEELSAMGYSAAANYDDYIDGYEQGIHDKGFMEAKARVAKPISESVSRYAGVWKASNGKWYLDLADDEYAEYEAATTYGPFASEAAAEAHLDNFSNPGNLDIDASGIVAPPDKSPNGTPVESPKQRRGYGSYGSYSDRGW